MLANLAALAGVFSLIITVILAVGVVFAFRGAANRSVTDLQKSAIEALQVQNDTQEKHITADEKEIKRLMSVITTIQYALKRRGLVIEINGESITLVDNQNQTRARTVQIRLTGEHEIIDKTENEEEL